LASAGKVAVDLSLAVKPKVGAGPSTLAGGTVALAAYALALVAYFQGARDEATISALAVGTVSLVTTLVGRFAQATAAVRLAKPAPTPSVQFGTAQSSTGAIVSGTSWTGPTPGAYVKNPDPGNDVMRDNALDPDPPAGPDPSIADPALDDPEHESVPTRAQHSGLKG
jgi:hypothetical protein